MILSPYLNLLQSEHQFQGNSNDCGPFCAAILLNAFKQLDVSGAELAKQMNRLVWNGVFPKIRRIPGWATFPWGIVDVLKEAEFESHWQMFKSISDIYPLITKPVITVVVIGEFHPLWSHYKILAAHESLKGWGFVNPAFPSGDLQWDTHSYFYTHWRNYGCQIIQVRLE
jgi:hypothetical protein